VLKKVNWLAIIALVPCLIFLISISMYHLSYYGYLGLPREAWRHVWAISENGLLLSLFVTIILLLRLILKLKLLTNPETIRTIIMMRNFFIIVILPYFVLKILYHISFYFNVYFWSLEKWEKVWSVGLVVWLPISLLVWLISIKKRHA
jgi:hypothetical protein